ncbi:hypothetical protein KL86APRO_40078 [uncultured Alphaproteobacteria bacterium]|uniref:Uncharacterized protein n=1 Tax=uncultured Alphaproteobacteria bacterium TaxID=91750 RepID=A0A212KMW0_9PROT|nr:hypothetical protein KL86APRO_40078 [uncultured Alphaproteobacteria bacterium]
MAFEIILPARGRAIQSGVTVAIRKCSADSQMIVIAMGPDVQLKCGWVLGDLILPRRGTGEDLGKLLLTKGGEGYRLRQIGSSKALKKPRLSISLPLWPGLAKEVQFAKRCSWKATPDGLLITLPEWAGRPPKRFDDAKRAASPAAKPYPAFS